VHALRNIHASLAPDGLLVDTQPISPSPRVTTNDAELGALDMRDWAGTIQAVDERVNETIAIGLYELTGERDFLVTSIFDDGPDCLAITGAWQGTRVPELLADRLAGLRDEVAVEQQIRLRVLRRRELSA
jgi:hypothetical protein